MFTGFKITKIIKNPVFLPNTYTYQIIDDEFVEEITINGDIYSSFRREANQSDFILALIEIYKKRDKPIATNIAQAIYYCCSYEIQNSFYGKNYPEYFIKYMVHNKKISAELADEIMECIKIIFIFE